MKKIFSLLLAASAFACTQEKVVEITISNPSTTDRTNEITEITSDAITKLKGETFIISDNTGSQVPYQITYDNKIIFPVSVKGGENVTYKITPGTPEAFKTIACEKLYSFRTRAHLPSDAVLYNGKTVYNIDKQKRENNNKGKKQKK